VGNDSAEAAYLRSEIVRAAQIRSLGAMFASPNAAQMMGSGRGVEEMTEKMVGASGQGHIAKIKPDVRQLQQILQGSCCVMVMQGATNGIAKAFLETTVQQWPKERLERLIAAMDGLLEPLQTAVKVHERYCPHEVLPMHKEIQNGYKAMRADINRMVDAARKVWEASPSPDKPERKVPVDRKINTAPMKSSLHGNDRDKDKLMTEADKEEALVSIRSTSKKAKK